MKKDSKQSVEEAQAATTTAVEPPAEAGSELGAIRIHHGVITIIARTTALRVPGVLDMSGSFAEGLANIIGKADRGVRVDMDDNSLCLELHVVLEYGRKIPEVAWQIQTEVRRVMEEMTGKNVKTVDVIVQEVRMPANKNKEEEKK
ncbi:MAG: Asp23/Gls24 family envelope stress response protein [Kiritimatiellia bacterium]|nr:Asp23/Gls24 family envelope stress response protein [Lentisphaerota bacterium]